MLFNFYSTVQIGAITRASRVDFGEISATLMKVQQECRASFDHLKTISKHDGATVIKSKYVTRPWTIARI